MHYVVTLTLPPELPTELREEQRTALGGLAASGALVLSGPFTDGRGGMAIFSAGSLDEARALYESTPFAASGAVKWDIREWDPRAGRLASELGR